MRASVSTCPICKKEARPRGENPCFPFCGARCKQIDLGAWVSEEYRLPAEESPDDDALFPKDPPK
jgi:endogenous inhibitor of DNA gyrase (YacG/DUF329 family)